MQGFSFVGEGGGGGRGDVQVANGTWSSLVTLRHVLLPQINACDEPKQRPLGFRNYYSWTLFPESAIGLTITSVYFFIDSMTALVLVDFNCVSDQRLYNIYRMFLLERLFSICRKNHFEDDLFSQVPLSGSQTGLTGLHESEATPRKASPKLARSFQFQDGRDSR